jgi:hypothetical protein
MIWARGMDGVGAHGQGRSPCIFDRAPLRMDHEQCGRYHGYGLALHTKYLILFHVVYRLIFPTHLRQFVRSD